MQSRGFALAIVALALLIFLTDDEPQTYEAAYIAPLSESNDVVQITQCTDNQILKSNAGTWNCEEDLQGSPGGGGGSTTITSSFPISSVTNPLTGAVALGISPCADQQVLEYNGVNGNWFCGAPPVDSITANFPLNAVTDPHNHSAIIFLRACAADEIIKYNSTNLRWECASDAGGEEPCPTTLPNFTSVGTNQYDVIRVNGVCVADIPRAFPMENFRKYGALTSTSTVAASDFTNSFEGFQMNFPTQSPLANSQHVTFAIPTSRGNIRDVCMGDLQTNKGCRSINFDKLSTTFTLDDGTGTQVSYSAWTVSGRQGPDEINKIWSLLGD